MGDVTPVTGCCTDAAALEVTTVANPPGRPHLQRRIGTHPTFLARLLAGLSTEDGSRGLTTRQPSDTAVALLDAWAVVADSLTFYTERIADENYIGTAGERCSVSELARLIGRQLRPGLAAETDLAFAMDTTPGAPARLLLEAGAPVQSEPEPGGTPAVFETVEPAELRAAWNRLRPRSGRLPAPNSATSVVHLAGTATNVRAGDGLLVREAGGAGNLLFGIVTTVTAVEAVPATPDDPGRPGRTEVRLRRLNTASVASSTLTGLVPPPAEVPTVPGVAGWLTGPVKAADLAAQASQRKVGLDAVAASFAARPAVPGSAVVFRTQAALFGSQAPDASTTLSAFRAEIAALGNPWLDWMLQPTIVAGLLPWPNATAAYFGSGTPGTVRLDNAYPSISAGGPVVLRSGATWGAYEVTDVATESFSAGGLTGKSTRLVLGPTTGLGSFPVRSTSVFAGAELVPLAPEPEAAPVWGTTLELEGLALGLGVRRRVAVSGLSLFSPGVPVVHVTDLAEVTHDFGPARLTRLTLAQGLPEPLVRSTVTVAANVVRATHGQSRHEVLGSGSGRSVFQQFRLKGRPLTYLSAPTATGRSTTLRVYVDDVQWREVPDLTSSGPADRVYTVREDEGGTIIGFGDGVTGARLPSGAANVRAVYRSGAGQAGRVGANRVTMLAARPPGLKGATNPRPAEGGADPETVDRARRSISLLVRTLGRVVSLRDYEDFARAFAGVEKAHAVWARVGGQRGVVVTVAGADGRAVPPGDPIHDALLDAFGRAGDPLVPVHLVTFEPRWFRVAMALRVAPDREVEPVHRRVEAELKTAFSFDARSLGQPVAASELLATAHRVPGVAAADLTLLAYAVGPATPPAPTSASTPVPARLAATLPVAGTVISGGTAIPAAQLLTIEPQPISIGGLP